jgi:SWI/SNF-related matrix-associated actin-dependent regulator 1 of chromatin subfamily A
MKRDFYIDALNKTVNFSFDYDKEISDRIKNADYNSRWNVELDIWVMPISDWTKDTIKYIVRTYGFKQIPEPTEEDVDFSYEKTEVDIAYLKGLCDAKGFTYTPRDYQLEALGFAIESGNILNGDDVGLGKTFESILYAETKDLFPCLVITPASVKEQWKEKWEEITGNKREVATIKSAPKKKDPNNWNADVVVVNYDILGKKQGRGATLKFQEMKDIEWKSIIFDEAHFLKNKTSIRAKAAKMLTKPDGIIIQMLTGTAIMSRPVEIWNLLKILKTDHLIAEDWYQFIRRYCGGYRGKFGWVTDGATNTIELNRKLRETFYIRREKRDVLKELPECTRQVFQVPITNLVKINKATTNFIEFVTEEKGMEAAEKAMEAEQLVMLGMLRKMAIEGKLKAIEQYLKDWKESGVKLLVFGLHREQLDYLSEKFKCSLIAGGTSATRKREIVLEWQKNDDVFLFGNMESAGTGVDGLQDVCSNMLIIELPWRPSDLVQAIGRLDRSGQKNATTVTFMLSDFTIDSQMWDMLSDKEAAAEAVNKGIDIRKQKSGMRDVISKILNK